VKGLQTETAQKCEMTCSMADKEKIQEHRAVIEEKLDSTGTQFASKPHKIFVPVDSSKWSVTCQLNFKRCNHTKVRTIHKLFPPVWEARNQYYR
jgi:hypothetical protein